MIEGRCARQSLSLLSIVAALLFLLHGDFQIVRVSALPDGAPADRTLLWIAAVLELIGGLMLLFGIFVAARCVSAVGPDGGRLLDVHAPQSTFPSENQGEPAILFCFVFLLIAAAGPGPWSIDASRSAAW